MRVRLRQTGKVMGVLLFVVAFAAPVGLVQAALVWQTETVDRAGDTGYSISMALDSSDQPHISYFNATGKYLKYASFDGTTWNIEIVDSEGSVGSRSSLALDGADRPHISYWAGDVWDLKYATYDGTAWQTETVASEGDVGSYSSLAVDSQGQPRISYYAFTGGDLMYAHHDGSGWVIETVDSEGRVGSRSSLVLDSADRPHISYFDDSTDDLKYTTFDGSAWQIETVDTAGRVGLRSSLALDADGRPHIAYVDDSLDLKYASFDGSTWQIETVDTEEWVGYHVSLALDSDDHPHISYFDETNDDLKYASFEGSEWQIQTIDAAGYVGWYPSLAFDSDVQPHIAYNDRNNGNLKYAQLVLNNPPNVDAGGPYSGEEGSSISLDGTVSDPEGDELTTTWSYTVDSADSGTTCAFGDASQVDTTFTCDDDGDFTVTLEVSDGYNTAVTDSATVTISNGAPTVTLSDDVAINEGGTYTDEGTAGDPGDNDILTATVDYEDGAGPQSLEVNPDGTFTLDHIYPQDGDYTVQVCVGDDDQGADCDDIQVSVLNIAPTVSLGEDVEINEGDGYTDSGSFSDPGTDDVHTANVDYGDGSGDQPLSLNPNGSFTLDHEYADDGQYTVEVCVTDEQASDCDDLQVIVINVAPTISDITVDQTGSQATVTVAATDPAGDNDPLSYAFDCTNDGVYDVGPQPENSATCEFGSQEGSFSIGVQVSDDDDGVTTETVSVTIATEMCASNYTGVLRYSTACQDHETAISIPDASGPVTVCASAHNGLLRLPITGDCAGHQITYVLPEDGPLSVCVSTYTQMMRVVDDLSQCVSHEFGRVIATSEVGETQPPQSR